MEIGIWEALGVMLGTGAASFAASWAHARARIGKLKRDAEEGQLPAMQTLSQRLATLEQQRGEDNVRLTKLETDRTHHDRDRTRFEQRLERLTERVDQCVTSEEFSAQVGTTNKSIEQLTDRVGRATGAIETWARGNR